MKIVFLKPTWYTRFCGGPFIYYRKFNQHKETMGWYDRKDTIYIVDQYNFFKNSLLVIHEYLHYLNDKVADFLWITIALIIRFTRNHKRR